MRCSVILSRPRCIRSDVCNLGGFFRQEWPRPRLLGKASFRNQRPTCAHFQPGLLHCNTPSQLLKPFITPSGGDSWAIYSKTAKPALPLQLPKLGPEPTIPQSGSLQRVPPNFSAFWFSWTSLRAYSTAHLRKSLTIIQLLISVHSEQEVQQNTYSFNSTYPNSLSNFMDTPN